MRLRFIFILSLLLFAAGQAAAQHIDVSGKVTDTNGEPVIGASVFVTGTTRGDITKTSGEFHLTGITEGEMLTVSCIGMKSVEVAAKPVLNIILETDDELLDEVLIVAFGQQTKSSFTGSAAVVKKESLEKKQMTNVLSGLQGEVAGMQMVYGSGSPSSTPSIAIRGFGSINAGTSPLIIVDGAPYDGGYNNINPNDVESITVLKDAASNALYGARGANGVIMITTKKAKAARASITLDAKWGVNSRATQDYDYIKDPGQYYEMYYKALYNYNVRDGGMSAFAAHQAANSALGKTTADKGLGYMIYSVPDGEYLIGTNGRINPHATLGNRVYKDGQVYTLYPDDWIDEAFRNSLRQEYNLSIAGGTDKLTFYGSLGYLDNQGIVYNSDYERYTARFKSEYQAREWMRVGMNLNYSHADSDEIEDGSYSLFSLLSNMAPIYPLYVRDGDGNIMTDEHGKVYDYGSGENGGAERPAQIMPQSNPLQENQLNTYNTVTNHTNLTGFADFTPFKGLKITLNGTMTNNEQKETSASQPFYGETAKSYPGGYIAKTAYQTFTLNFQQLINYTIQLQKHNISVMAGHENYNYKYSYVGGVRTGMFSFFESQELNGAINVYDNASSTTKYNTEGYFTRGMWNYDEKYFLSASFRRDASSRFHPDHRWGNFYSFGGAWTINKENWFKSSWLDMLKLKASWGQQGNDSIGYYRYTDTYSIENSSGEVALVLSSVGNKEISWETNSNFNTGVEFDMLKGRISGSVEYFYRKTTDMLCKVYAPLSGGYTYIYDNVGNMRNQGAELDLHINLLKTKSLNWNLNLNATHYRNAVTKLSEDNKSGQIFKLGEDRSKGNLGYTNGYYFVGEGLPLHTFRLKKFAGLTDTGKSTWYVTDSKTGEISTTTSYTDASYYNCGSADPDLYGGFSTNLSWKGLDFSVSFSYSLGGKALDYGYQALMGNPTSTTIGQGFHKDLYNAWSETNTDTDIPRFQYAVDAGDTNSSSISDKFLTNASTLTLQNVNIGYTLPRKWTDAMKIGNVRVYVQGDNLYYWSKRKGFDPRGSFWGSTTTTSYSQVRTFTGGVTIQF